MTHSNQTGNIDTQYLMLVNKILGKLDQGTAKDRTGAGRLRIFSHQMRFDLREEFPLLALKKTHFASIVKELAWFCRGETNIETLGCSIWDEWSHLGNNPDVEVGTIGPMYGEQWRNKRGIGPFSRETVEDQLKNVLREAARNPNSSRLIVDSWDPNKIPRHYLTVQENLEQGYMALAPCHFAFQFFCETIDGVTYMDIKPHCRSQDVFLGTPFNIASYALLLILSAQYCGYTPREVIPDLGDCHLYGNHLDKVDEFLLQARTHIAKTQEAKRDGTWKPTTIEGIEGITPFNISEGDNVDRIINGLRNYNPSAHIKFARN